MANKIKLISNSKPPLRRNIEPITRLMYDLYADYNFTLQDLADMFGKVSKQAVHIRFKRCNLTLNGPGNKYGPPIKYPKWQVNLMNKAASYGLTVKQVSYILSVDPKSLVYKVNSGNFYPGYNRGSSEYNSRHKKPFKNPQVTKVYREFERLMFAHAYNNGATVTELSEIFNYTLKTVEQTVQRLRKSKRYNIKYRREDCIPTRYNR